MVAHELLNNISHKDLRILTERSLDLGDNIPSILAFPNEFRQLQADFPICFCKDPDTGTFHCAAILGFEDEENLFFLGSDWQPQYVPLMLQKGPFLIGESSPNNSDDAQPMIYVDMDHPRVNLSEGEQVFLEHGGNTDFLEKIRSILDAIYQGRKYSESFIELVLENELIEDFSLEINLSDGSQNSLRGFYTIAEKKLNALPYKVIEKLMLSGYLQAIYMMIASFENFKKLIYLKDQGVAT